MKKYKLGFTAGAFDVFHIGHLNLIRNSKKKCKKLIVGVNSDLLIKTYKNKITMEPEHDRLQIVSSIKFVDKCVLIDTLDKVFLWNIYHFDVVFIGDDWKGNPRWIQTENELKKIGVDVIYLPYTKSISSSKIREQNNGVISTNEV